MDAGVAVDQGHSVDDLGVIDQDHGQHDHGHLHRQEVSVAHGILPRAVPCILERLCFVCLPQLCNVVCQRIVGVGCRKKSLLETFEVYEIYLDNDILLLRYMRYI